jgi:pimeloyl-ACP methyl ester carboxylesterase
MCSKIKFLLKDGTKIASRQWGVGNSTKLLCFHGWLDNSNTFSAMAPYLAERGMEVTAVDLLGHGDSSHEKPVHFTQYVCVARQILESMKYDKINLVGHSMGGSVALMLAGTYPELVEKLILIESFGVMVRDADDAAAVLRKSIDAQLQHTEKGIHLFIVISIQVSTLFSLLRSICAYVYTPTLSTLVSSLSTQTHSNPFNPPKKRSISGLARARDRKDQGIS